MTPDPFIQRSIARIRQHAAGGTESMAAFARRAGVGKSTLTGVADPDWNPTADILLKLELAIPAGEIGDPVEEAA